MNIVVCVKQVPDPEQPASNLRVDANGRRVTGDPNVRPVINGYDENAVEAALRLKEAQGGKISILSVGAESARDVIKHALSMGADEGYIVEDPALSEADPWMIASALGAAIGKIGDTDLVLCGRQASDDDNGQVGPTLAEVLGLPCVTVLRAIQAQNGSLRVEQLIPDGFRAFQVPLPALLSISNEYGKPRYPTTRGIMLAARKQITAWSAAELGLGPEALKPRLQHVRYFIPARESRVEFITGETLEEAGEKLALRLREEKLI